MRILKYLLFLFLIIVIGFSIYIAIQPDNYKITREYTITAPKSVIYKYINNFKEWPKWSPWNEKKANTTISFGDSSSGNNASYSWNGKTTGQGTIKTIFSSQDSISQAVNFISPYESDAHNYWTLKSTTGKKNNVLVTWGIEGTLSFTEKALIFLQGGMESVVGLDFQQSLHRLDSLVQEDMKAYSISLKGETEYGGGYYLYQTTSTKQNEVDLATERMFPEILAFMEQHDIQKTGSAFTIFKEQDDTNSTTIVSSSIPVKERVITPAGSTVLCGYLKPGTYYKTVLKGNHDNLKEAWSKTYDELKKNEIEIDPYRDAFETYVKTSEDYENPADLITEIYIPTLLNTDSSE
ncbi:transcriptional regulator [Galbibacter sp. EGI 63066]|uniref:SRPBCC family protein n=1 Tax=Galbibacter sp. EGI 63066 TaxID=2993559 RepID=UPI0022490FCB|nr:GyrI-like domain-containing protein [Galbibacter sp. EGI 63066]MCX2680294.1 transcriptional regulator [Galbibacter sp. EGI 63066]